MHLAIAPLSAQEPGAAALERRHEEERYRVLSERIAHLSDAQDVIRRNQQKLNDRLDSLAAEITRMKEDYARANVNIATADQLKTLVEKLQEVDRKREADKELFLKTIKDLAKLPAPVADSPAPRTGPTEAPEGYWQYEVKKGNNLSMIVRDYNAELETQGFERLTAEQIKQANPKLSKRNYLLEGETLLIPIPPKKKRK